MPPTTGDGSFSYRPARVKRLDPAMLLGGERAPGDGGRPSALAALDAILGAAEHPLRVIKNDPRSRVIVVGAGGCRWVLKTYRLPWVKRLLYGPLGRTLGGREASGAAMVGRAGVRHAPVAALVWHGARPVRETVVLPFIEGRTLDQHLRRLEESGAATRARKRAALARSIGEQMGRLTAAGIVNRDHKPSNLMVDDRCAVGGEAPVLLDPAGVGSRRSVSQTHRMIARLEVSLRRVTRVSRTERLRCLTALLREAGMMDDRTSRAGRHELLRRWTWRIEAAEHRLR